MANASYEDHPTIPGLKRLRTTPIDFEALIDRTVRTAKQEAATDLEDPVYRQPDSYEITDLSTAINRPSGSPTGPGHLETHVQANGNLEFELTERFTRRKWLQGYNTGAGTYGGWTLVADRGFAQPFAGTEVLDRTVPVSSGGDEVADLTTITDGPGGLTGRGLITSKETPAGSGFFYRELTELSTGAVYSNYFDGASWLPDWVQSSGGGGLSALSSLPAGGQIVQDADLTPDFVANPVLSAKLELTADSGQFVNLPTAPLGESGNFKIGISVDAAATTGTFKFEDGYFQQNGQPLGRIELAGGETRWLHFVEEQKDGTVSYVLVSHDFTDQIHAMAGASYDFEDDPVNNPPANATVVKGTWDVVGGLVAGRALKCITTTNGDAVIDMDLFGAQSDYSVTMRVAEGGVAPTRFGPVLRGGTAINPANDSREGYLFLISTNGAGNVSIRLSNTSGFTTLATYPLAPPALTVDRWYRMTADGDQLTAEFSDDGVSYTALGTVTDATYSSGVTQLAQGFSQGQSGAHYDEIAMSLPSVIRPGQVVAETIHGIDDVLAQAQALTADRNVDLGGNDLTFDGLVKGAGWADIGDFETHVTGVPVPVDVDRGHTLGVITDLTSTGDVVIANPTNTLDNLAVFKLYLQNPSLGERTVVFGNNWLTTDGLPMPSITLAQNEERMMVFGSSSQRMWLAGDLDNNELPLPVRRAAMSNLRMADQTTFHQPVALTGSLVAYDLGMNLNNGDYLALRFSGANATNPVTRFIRLNDVRLTEDNGGLFTFNGGAFVHIRIDELSSGVVQLREAVANFELIGADLWTFDRSAGHDITEYDQPIAVGTGSTPIATGIDLDAADFMLISARNTNGDYAFADLLRTADIQTGNVNDSLIPRNGAAGFQLGFLSEDDRKNGLIQARRLGAAVTEILSIAAVNLPVGDQFIPAAPFVAPAAHGAATETGIDLSLSEFIGVSYYVANNPAEPTNARYALIPTRQFILGSDFGGLGHYYDNDYIQLRIEDEAAMRAGQVSFRSAGQTFAVSRVEAIKLAPSDPLDASSYPAVGSENIIGLNNTDTTQSALDKIEAFNGFAALAPGFVDLGVGVVHEPAPINIANSQIITGHDFAQGDTLHFTIVDNGNQKPWPNASLDIATLVSLGSGFLHVFDNDFVNVALVDAATGTITIGDVGREMGYIRSWMTKRTQVLPPFTKEYVPPVPLVTTATHTLMSTGLDLSLAHSLEVSFIQDSMSGNTVTGKVRVAEIALGIDQGGLMLHFGTNGVQIRIEDAAALTAGDIQFRHFGQVVFRIEAVTAIYRDGSIAPSTSPAELQELTLAAAVVIPPGAFDDSIVIPFAGAVNGDVFSTPSVSEFSTDLVKEAVGVDAGGVHVSLWNKSSANTVTLPIGTVVKVAKLG